MEAISCSENRRALLEARLTSRGPTQLKWIGPLRRISLKPLPDAEAEDATEAEDI